MADETFDNIYINNNIGIGTNEPTARLHIVSPTEISNKVFLENVDGSLLKISTETSSASIGTENAFPLSIQTDGVPRISISGTGNITITESLSVQNSLTVTGNTNIGTDTTPANLQVKGNVTANAFSGNGTTLSGLVKQAGDTMSGPLTVQNSLTVTGNTNIGTDTTPANLQVKGNVTANAFSGNGTTLSGLVKQAGDTMSGPLTIQSNLSVSGNVGIGTTTPPTAKLEVNGSLTVTGNVGIGTRTPATTLEVNGTVRATAFQGNGSGLTNLQLPDSSISTAKLADSAITSAKLANNSVSSAKLANNVVTKQHIQNGSVAIAQLSATLIFEGQVSLQDKQVSVGIEYIPPYGSHRFYLVSLFCLSATFPPGIFPPEIFPPNAFVQFPVQFRWLHSILASPIPAPAGVGVPVQYNVQQLLIENLSEASAMTLACKVYRLDEA